MDNNFNYYELLGVKEDATDEEIKIAYKKQMKKWHPDINKDKNAGTISARINEAKEILLDPVKRYDYNEYLKKKINENYNKYTQRKNTKTQTENEKTYEDKKLTKWQYLKEWLKYSRISKTRKIIGVIGVLIESFICFLLKWLIVIIAYISTLGSYFIRMLYKTLAPILIIIIVLFVGTWITNGFKETMDDNPEFFTATILIPIIYIVSLLLPILTSILLSPKTFDILYNKIDINLFKICVGYKE